MTGARSIALLCIMPALATVVAAATTAPSVRYAGYRWAVEAENPATTKIRAVDGTLRMQAARGLTVWLATPLKPPYEIDYRREVLALPDETLRISDMNQFWAARLAATPGASPFRRSGAFAGYDDLAMYYAGIGGNTNTTTRFRRYDGRGGRPLLGEYLDARHLLRGGHVYRVRIVVGKGETVFYLDGHELFSAKTADASPGYFGLRLTGSSQVVSDFQVHTLR